MYRFLITFTGAAKYRRHNRFHKEEDPLKNPYSKVLPYKHQFTHMLVSAATYGCGLYGAFRLWPYAYIIGTSVVGARIVATSVARVFYPRDPRLDCEAACDDLEDKLQEEILPNNVDRATPRKPPKRVESGR